MGVQQEENARWIGARRGVARLIARLQRGRTFGWAELDSELDRCVAPAVLWWRDDDAVADTRALTDLLRLRAEFDLPLALAVVPAQAKASLAAALAEEKPVFVLQHGWDHTNHAAADAPPSEFPADRDWRQVQAQLSEGRRRLEDLFAGKFIPALVPPFNALAAEAVDAVCASGLSQLSLATDFAGLGLPSRNIHADLIDWRLRQAAPVSGVIRSLVLALRLRRYGVTRAARPIGVMTHHLAHDESIWSLARALLGRLKAHPNVVFAPIEEVFA